MLLALTACSQLVNVWLGRPFLGPAMMMAIIHIWARKDPDRQVAVWGFAFPAWQFPFVMVLFHMLVGGDIIGDLMGIFVGHVFFYLSEVYPRVTNRRLLATPQFLYDMFSGTNAAGRSMGWQRGTGHRLQ